MTGAVALRQSDEVWDSAIDTSAGRRFFDSAASAWMVKVFPGEFYVTKKADEVVLTVLGSCVAARRISAARCRGAFTITRPQGELYGGSLASTSAVRSGVRKTITGGGCSDSSSSSPQAKSSCLGIADDTLE